MRTSAIICACLLLSAACHRSNRLLVLEGTIVTPDRVIERGWVVVEGGTISQVSDTQPDAASALRVKVDGVIFPGLIDLHNHLAWNALPRWAPKRHYANRYEWRNAYEYEELIASPARSLQQRYGCEMNQYGEVRALVGGTTSIQSSARGPCLQGLVRNLDERFDQILDIGNVSDEQRARIAQRMAIGGSKALFVHLAEGRPGDGASRDEFAALVSAGLLGKRTVIIHGTALGDEEFRAMAHAGASLVWSPQSNIALYGETTNILAARERGVSIALAPDWAITGSASILDELAYAASLNDRQLETRLTDTELVAMVTHVPAAIAGMAAEVGAIRQGLSADLLVVKGERRSPYRSLIEARPKDVRLVMVAGEAVYGANDLMRQLADAASLEDLSVCGETMALRVSPGDGAAPGARERAAAVEQRLKRAITRVSPWLTLAPLAHCG